jgi:two-component system, LytTR family, response regulator LytT
MIPGNVNFATPSPLACLTGRCRGAPQRVPPFRISPRWNARPVQFACAQGERLYSAFGSTTEAGAVVSPFEWMSINTIIVDDEKPARDELAFLLKGFPEINVIGQGKNGVEAVALIKEHSPDLVFLDVKMPGLDGFGVLKKLVAAKMKMPHVVFATAFDQYAVQAFDVNAVDYVLKPFDKARIAKAIARARKMVESQTSTTERLEQLVSQLGAAKPNSSPPVKILVRAQQKLLLVDGEDLVWASVDRGLVSVMARETEGSSNYRTLEDLTDALDSESFWRPHRSFLVNIHHIKEVVPWFNSTYMLKMNDKKHTEIPVSRTQIKRMRELFKL